MGQGDAPASAEEGASDEAAEAVESAPTAGETAEVSLWIFEGEEGFLPRLEEEFEALNPDIDLQITEIPEGDYVTKIDTALAANAWTYGIKPWEYKPEVRT